LQYCNLRAKDGICDRLRDLEGARPSIDTVRPDARVHLFLSHDTGTMYLDTSGESLFKRGWRLDKGDAPLRENLAAGLLALSGWDPEAALLDPFCGSGTILIEAAWIALGVPPGITRPFGFERLRDHDAHRWEDLKDEARSRILLLLSSQQPGDLATVEGKRKLAQDIAAGPAFGHAMTKRMLAMEWAMSVEQAIEAEAVAQALCMTTQDFRRAYDAFVAKRRPEFKGN
jgi:23S rRNA G2445 N2-methylase RlmL